MTVELVVGCAFCDTQSLHEVVLPEGWELPSGDAVEHTGLCPEHAPIADFIEAQCTGCFERWGDCSLWQSFAYKHRRSLTKQDIGLIGDGVCPRRQPCARLSMPGEPPVVFTRASPESGDALVRAIGDYWRIYGDR